MNNENTDKGYSTVLTPLTHKDTGLVTGTGAEVSVSRGIGVLLLTSVWGERVVYVLGFT